MKGQRPFRVLSVVASLPFGGDESRLASMVQSIDRERFQFSVVVMPQVEDFDRKSGAMRPILEAAGIEVVQLEQPQAPAWMPRPLRGCVKLLRKIQAVAKLIRDKGVDLVDARLDGGILVGIPASVATGRPSISTLYSPHQLYTYPLWKLVQWINLNLTTAVVTDSAARQSEFEEWVFRPRRVWNIPNGIPVPSPVRDAAAVRAELGIPARVKVILQVAAIVPYKGPMILVEAARRVVDEYPDAFFLLIGYSREGDELHANLLRRISELGLGANVAIHPYPGPIGDVWQIADIHVHASTFDSLPNAILEGMALGKPAVVTNVGGIAEAVENEKTGLVVPPNDPEAIAKGLLRLLKNPQEAKSFGDAAQARYHERYRPESMARALEQCFHKVLEVKP